MAARPARGAGMIRGIQSMRVEYQVATCESLAGAFAAAGVHRPMRIERYEPGTELSYDVVGVIPRRRGRVTLRVESFVGGGFAGQVYRVSLRAVEGGGEAIAGLSPGGVYAMKILVPPSRGARVFRDGLYALGFQGPFQLQVNPAAARAGALWQKFIRRAAARRFGTELAVVDVLATFVDPVLGSCGELSEWIDGRTWRFEVDDHMGELKRWRRGRPVDPARLGSPEYRAKRTFMKDFVRLLHELGAPELARQYEWWTCKSQPNCLKRRASQDDPEAGLTAVDFRAGLALLPFLPMSPADVPLIARGIARGSLVQFDRGDTARLAEYVGGDRAHFAGMEAALDELVALDRAYREALPDVTRHHVRLLVEPSRWARILDGLVTSWGVRGMADARAMGVLRASRIAAGLFAFLGLLPLAGIAGQVAFVTAATWQKGFSWWWSLYATAGAAGLAAAASAARTLWGRADLRAHYGRMLTRPGYLARAVKALAAERAIGWLRRGRVGDDRAGAIAASIPRFLLHLALSLLPAWLHRMLTDRRFARDALRYVFLRPVKLYFDADAREQWLRDMIEEGRVHHMLTGEDAEAILARIKEPFIRKYLKSLAVHVCTLPVTQLVAVGVAAWGLLVFDMTWVQAWAWTVGVLVFFQTIPVSPGSLVRGLYVVYLVIRERNLKDYQIAVCVGFFKYVGYLAFPIQMAYRYPQLARFMAGHWATGVVHIVPVFGERGALLEHAVFGLCYNWPLTLRRRMRERAAQRVSLQPRAWHVPVIVVLAAGVCAVLASVWTAWAGAAPRFFDMWFAWPPVAAALGAGAAMGAGGLPLSRRVAAAAAGGLALALAHAGIHAFMPMDVGGERLAVFGETALWAVFIHTLCATLGAIAVEVFTTEPRRGP